MSKGYRPIKKWCDVCYSKTVFSKTNDCGFVCTRCGKKIGGGVEVARLKNIEKRKEEGAKTAGLSSSLIGYMAVTIDMNAGCS